MDSVISFNESGLHDWELQIQQWYFKSGVSICLSCGLPDFRLDPPENNVAFGIAQITKETLNILQDSQGEAKDFVFNGIRQMDLKNPYIAIPMGIRWLMYKCKRAEAKLGRPPTHEEIILEYKG